jgi:hypothetical protein
MNSDKDRALLPKSGMKGRWSFGRNEMPGERYGRL